jgi:LCP family protein required for cell wall assembly
MDATTVDDLIARYGGNDAPGESRRHRRHGAGPDEAVPAGELIAALTQASVPGPSPATTGPATMGSATLGAAPLGAASTNTAAAVAAPDVPSDTPHPAGTADIDHPAPLTADIPVPPYQAAGGLPLLLPPAGPAGGAPADSLPTEVLPAGIVLVEALPTTALPATADDDGPHTQPIAAVVPDRGAEVPPESILASLRRELGGSSGGSSGASGSEPPRSGRPSYGDTHHHRAWWSAGRALVAMVAVLVLLITGTEWVIKHRADKVLADNHVSAIVPDDTNISQPTVDHNRGASGTAAGTRSAAPAGNAGNQTYQPENILLMGSDTRLGAENAKLGNGSATQPGTMQSDVLMIAHLSADRQHVTILSIPRDLYVKAPTCKAWDYTTNTLSNQDYVTPYTTWKITNAFSVGGPQCTVKALQELTGLKITRVIIIDFSGFKAMVDALDGITINVCKPIVDEQLGTVVASAGVQKIDGAQALSLVRARKVKGDPTGDIGRIRRQQVVLSTLLRQVTRAGVLLNPPKLDSLLQAFVNNTHTDNVTLDDLIQLAQSLGNLSPSHVTFYTLPTVNDPDGQGEDMTSVAPAVFNALVNDQPLPGEATSRPSTKSSTSATTPTTPAAGRSSQTPARSSTVVQSLTVAPGSVNLQVVNVTGRAGEATRAKTALNGVGFAVTDQDLLLPQGQLQTPVTVEYDPANEAAALTVAAAVPGAELVPTPGLGTQVRLMLGSNFDGTVHAVALGQPVTESVGSAPGGSAAGAGGQGAPSSASRAPTTSSPSQTLTTGELSAINAETAGCA